MEELSRQIRTQKPCDLRNQTQHQWDGEQFSMTGAQGAAEARDEESIKGGPCVQSWHQ